MTAVISKVLKIVDYLAAAGDEPVSLADMTRETGIPKATLYRLLGDLVEPAILEHGAGGYTLGTRLFELGATVPRYAHMRRAAAPYLEELANVTQETVHLATRVGDQVLYVDKIHGRTPVRVPTAIGGRLPMHCTALGKAMLAHAEAPQIRSLLRQPLQRRTAYTVVMPKSLLQQLSAVRNDGVAVECEETRLGLGCVAAPIVDESGRSEWAISIAGDPRSKRNRSVVARVRTVADQLAQQYALAASA